MRKPRLFHLLGVVAAGCLACSALAYSRYVDWPSLGGEAQVREYLPERYPLAGTHHYTYSNFMDTWELYRFTTTPEAIAYLADGLGLSAPAPVREFPLIISRPPPYWWHPETLQEAQLYRNGQRAPDGHMYDLLYSADSGVAYLIRFDG
jgi:hypothetical protein